MNIIREIIDKEFKKWADEDETWEGYEVRDFAYDVVMTLCKQSGTDDDLFEYTLDEHNFTSEVLQQSIKLIKSL